MRISSILLAVLMSVNTLNAHAWSLWELNGAKMDIDGKDVRVASVNTFGSSHIFHSKDKEFEKGVYVVATIDESSSQGLPRTTALIRDYLRSRGVNVADKPDGCAIGVKFAVFDLNIDSSSATPGSQPDGKSKSLSDNAVDLVTQAGLTRLAFKLNGATGVLTYGLSQGHYEGAELKLNSISIVEPAYDKLGVDAVKFAREKNGITARTSVENSDPKTTTADLLILMVKVWADKYFVRD